LQATEAGTRIAHPVPVTASRVMTDNPDPIPARQPRISAGAREIDVLDPLQVTAVSADLIVEAREASGIVALGFATLYTTGNSPGVPELRVCSRLRMSLALATDLRNMLDSILKGAMAPKGEAH
jgi:hypothetical protein